MSVQFTTREILGTEEFPELPRGLVFVNCTPCALIKWQFRKNRKFAEFSKFALTLGKYWLCNLSRISLSDVCIVK